MDPLTTQALTAVLSTSNGPILALLMGCVIHLYRLEKQCTLRYEKLLEELARSGCVQEGCPQRRAVDRLRAERRAD